MEVNTKLKELEEEFKVLKAEIRNVLLDIREVILDRTNPLGEEHESAHLTLDLNTTARAMATEVAAHEAVKANEEAEHGMDEHIEPPVSLLTASPGLVAANDDGVQDDPEPVAPEPLASNDELEEAPAPKVIRLNPTADSVEFQPEGQLPTEIPHMYQATVPPLSGNISISAWLTEALEAVGPQELERIITIHRLWGNLPSNISRALAYLQELLKQADENEPPPWLKVMQELDRLASL